MRIPQLDPVNLCYVENDALCALNPFCRWNHQHERCEPNPDAYNRLRYPRAIANPDWVLPGYWVAMGEDAWHHLYEPDMVIPYRDPATDQEIQIIADADERRDLCFD